MRLKLFVPLMVAALLTVGGSAAADTSQLTGVVGPGFNISLQDGSGARVTNLAPGTYTLTVQDKSDIHNFHLAGPGVDVATDIDFVGTQTFTVTLTNGTYRYDCDAHAATMKGSFTVGTPAPTTTTTQAKPKPALKKHKHAKHKHAKKKRKKR
jgi:hypothetical protein